MFDISLSVAISFTITFLAIPVIINVAESKKLFDVPDSRKIHNNPIPSLGGLGIFAGFVLSCMVIIPFAQASEFQYFFAAALVIFFLGLKDDILDISPIKKFIGQVLAAFLIIYKGNIQIQSMHGFMGINELPPMFSLIFTYLTVIVIINSFNLIDGVDGLAGSLALMAAIIFGVYFSAVNMVPYAILSFALAGSLVAFLIFNFQPAKVFMGDTGSLLLGLIHAILVIKFINVANAPDAKFAIGAAPAVGFSVLMIPLLDTLRVFGIRIFHRRSPFSPDRNHVHHLLLDRGLSHRTVTITLVSLNLLFIIVAFSLRSLGCTALIFGIFGVFFSGIGMLYYTRKKTRLFVAKTAGTGNDAKPSKIVSLTKDAVLEQK
ncbi:MAG: undecaprenyl/decaprenyl-phosphate alpha-N-acetylglucosaminyl 1-phosphate transferase [Gemmatimonadaceae bacterium]|nr:undecaprenyl/decaprenyl-phosphate alpha-N-acetylglucosaminyl 1-phosphate transferase [Chitinophagaceae bacterium]